MTERQPIDLDALAEQWHNDQRTAASRTVETFVRALAADEPVTTTPGDLVDDQLDLGHPIATLGARQYVAWLRSGKTRRCKHLHPHVPAPEIWTTAIPQGRWCGRRGCDITSVYVALLAVGLLPASCAACGKRGRDTSDPYRVALDTALLLVHICPDCEAP